jgi:HSP20 family protein
MATRWNPFDEMAALHNTMWKLLESNQPQATGANTWQTFPLNVFSREQTLVVEALLPGVSQEDVQVSIDRGVLTIAAQRQGWQPNGNQEQVTWYLREAPAGQFRRAISLPFPIDAEAARANYTNGVLTLTLPKAEAARPRQIPIQAGEAQLTTGATN